MSSFSRSNRRRVSLVLVAALPLLAASCGSTVPLALQRQAQGLQVSSSGPGSLSGQSAASGGGQGGSLPASGSAAAGGGSGSGYSASSGATGSGSALPGAGSSSGGGSTSSASVVTGPAAPGAGGSLAVQGRGWDAKHVYIGVPTEDDLNGLASQEGVNFNGGNVNADVQAVVADINSHGGIFGRQLVVVFHDNSTTSLESDPSSDAQSTCTDFTQDHPVAAVINGLPLLDTDSWRSCLQQAHVPLFSLFNDDYSNTTFSQFGPYLFSTSVPSVDDLVPTWLARLKADGYFSSWDSVNGAPGTAPVRVGIMEPDDTDGHYVESLIAKILGSYGITVASTFFYNPSDSGSESQTEVLQFKSALVTHVLTLPPVEADQALFMSAAETQHYRPRYGMTSFSLPLTVEQNPEVVSPNQLAGVLGVGWQPANDVDAAHDPGPTPGQARCLSALQRGGQTFDSSQRRAELLGLQICDAVYFFAAAAEAGGGFAPPAILAGVAAAAPHFPVASVVGPSFSAASKGLVGYGRDFQWNSPCGCFEYFGSTYPFTS